MLEIFKAVVEYLLSLDFAQNSGLPERFWQVKHSDLYEKQPNRSKGVIAYETPAVFVEFLPTRATEKDNIIREDFTINFHIESLDWGSGAANSHNREESLTKLLFLELIKGKLLEWVTPRGFSRLVLAGRKLDQEGRNNPVNTLTFTTTHNKRREC